MIGRLGLHDFASFFEEVRGYRPFPWQERLVDKVAASGIWPDLLDLPTGAGKTALLDIAVFLLALQAGNGVVTAPRRTVLVVDRRVVVDQAAEAGRALVTALLDPPGPVLDRVARALRSLSDEGQPLLVGTLRGGIVRDESWARRPDVPSLLSSTVDQVGSRLLFRGYGITQGMRPIHAGLLGTDTLILLDEVHLSQPFAETLRALKRRYQNETPLPSRWQVVELSATPGAERNHVFRLDPRTDLDPQRSPVLRRRVVASKPVELREARAGGKSRVNLARACVTAVDNLLSQPHVNTVGVVVNRVETARQVERDLRERMGVPTLLLTGRMRPFDRDDALDRHRERLRTGREPRDDGTLLVLVGTQSIEAGADFDLDGLVTECASLDALQQRFGRLDRAGDLSEQGTPAPGIVLASPADVSPNAKDDPVYGGALRATWEWLGSVGDTDFGTSHLPKPDAEQLKTLQAPRRVAPALLPAHLDVWAQTSPAPDPSPDVALWLHGLGETSTDVQVVWRADLTERFLGDATTNATARDQVISLVQACPPGSGEAATVPLRSLRRWLRGSPQADEGVADVDGAAEPEDPQRETIGYPRPFLRWRGEDSEVVPGTAPLSPGDVVVVPSSYGGLSAGSWDPEATAEVEDFGHRTQLRQRRRVVLRLLPQLLRAVGVPRPSSDEEVHESDSDVVHGWLRQHAEDLPGEDGEAARLLTGLKPGQLRVMRVAAPQHRQDATESAEEERADWYVCSAVVTSHRRVPIPNKELTAEADSEPEVSAFNGTREVNLEDHLQGVARQARAFARCCGMPEDLAHDLHLAARIHDLGKADPRFQLWLHDGDELAAAAARQLLAKSAVPETDWRRRELARERSGYPKGARHELLSVALAESADLLQAAHDRDLVLHLVASHHGYCRPFAPAIIDSRPRPVRVEVEGETLQARTDHGLERLDAGPPDRFWGLVERYGWFRLAWIEAVLRLADHHRSAEEQQVAGDGRANE